MNASSARQDLLHLVAGFRSHLEHRARSGLLGVSLPAPEAPAAARPSEQAAVARDGATRLPIIRAELGDCQRCKLHPLRKNIVFGVGNPNADLVFVGESPGADEDAQGEPFVGAAGQLLDKMIVAMGFAREDVYICNVLKCRPPGNRKPEPDEVEQCEPFLKQQLRAIAPRIIVALGKFAAHSLCGVSTPITRLRGTMHTYEGIPVMPTYHPAFLLRDPARKGEVWQDLKTVLVALEAQGIRPPRPPKA